MSLVGAGIIAAAAKHEAETSPVRWTQIVQNMIADGASDFTECGPGKALQGMIAKINRDIPAHGIIA